MPSDVAGRMRDYAIKAFGAARCEGFARVDFFWEPKKDAVLVNEINTLPGITKMSMFPKLWEATELKYPRLIERLLQLGLERSKARAARAEGTMKWFLEVKSIT